MSDLSSDSRNLPSTYQQVIANRDDIKNLQNTVDGYTNPSTGTYVPGLDDLVNGYTDPATGEAHEGIAEIVIPKPDPEDPTKPVETLGDRVTKLETSYDAGKVVSVDGSQLPLSVIPKAALERIFDVTDISVLSSKTAPGYPTEADTGDTICDLGHDSQMYMITDDSVLGTPNYMNGLKTYSAGYAANAGMVNGHTVEEDVPLGARFTDTVSSAYCTTDGDVTAKTAICDNYVLASGNWLQILIAKSNTVGAALTLNVNGTGAKAIYINDAISSSVNSALPAGCYFAYYGTRTVNGTTSTGYWFRTDGNLPNVTVPNVDVMTGATDSAPGTSGVVPAPAQGAQRSVLTGAGTWEPHYHKIVSQQETPATGTLNVGDYWLQTIPDE